MGVLPIDFCVESGGNMLKLMECVRTIPQVTCLKLSADARLRDPYGPCNKRRIARHSAVSPRPCTARTTRPWSCLPQQKRNVSGKLLAASVKQLAEVRLFHVLSSQEIRIECVCLISRFIEHASDPILPSPYFSKQPTSLNARRPNCIEESAF